MIHSYIPSPPHGVWHLGPIPIRAYALIILSGIFVAVSLGNKRWVARGGRDGQVADVAIWAVPFGVIGGRVYHVLTDWSAYFGDGGKGFLGALRIWEGGLGIWGAIALGALGAWIGCSRHGVAFAPFADSIAPGIAIAQAIGRWGNWFNQELFGKPTKVTWALSIDPQNRPAGFEQYATFHPTFLYESIACVAITFFVMWADKRFTLGHGRAFALYVALYCAVRGVIETLRIDEAHHIFGVRLNVFTALVVGFGALWFLVRSAEHHPGREVMENGRVVGNLIVGDGYRARRAHPESLEQNHNSSHTDDVTVLTAPAPVAQIPSVSRPEQTGTQQPPERPRGRRIKDA
ncbi:MAG: prolipoprotein diacylglyceryl transferase [Actinomycetes bacterium]